MTDHRCKAPWLVLIAPLLSSSCSRAPAPIRAVAAPITTALVGVSVVPLDRERVLPSQTVLVQGDRTMRTDPLRTLD